MGTYCSRSVMIKLTVPGNPLSVNHLYGQHGKRRFLYAAGKKYKELVAKVATDAVKGKKLPTSEDIALMVITYYFPDRRRRDVTNYDKSPIDALTGIIYDDDCQIQMVVLRKSIDKANPRTEIMIDI